MLLDHSLLAGPMSRRTMLTASAWGLGCLGATASKSATAALVGGGGRAKSAILIWLSGGVSHIDTWDMKPKAPREYRGEFEPITTSASGLEICEHLPKLAKQAHHLAVIRSLGHFGRGTGDHHAGYYYNLTGHAPDPSFRALLNSRTPRPDDWPFMGSVVASKRAVHPDLPSLITLPQKPGAPEYTRPGQFAARLGFVHDPVYVLGENPQKPLDFMVPALSLEGNMTANRLLDRRGLLARLDQASSEWEQTAATSIYAKHQQKAFSLLSSARSKAAFDVSQEPEALRLRYGQTINGMSMLMARRLVEADVPFVSVFWKEDPKLNDLCKSGGGWDTHGNNFNCLRDHLLPQFDQAFSTLLDDLHQRGLLEQTLIIVTSEMGRAPKIGDPRSGGTKGAGRDHWTHCMSTLLAGGGVQGGQAYGTSDKIAAYPADKPVAPEDITQTVYHAMGIKDLQFQDPEGRLMSLLNEGRPLLDLF